MNPAIKLHEILERAVNVKNPNNNLKTSKAWIQIFELEDEKALMEVYPEYYKIVLQVNDFAIKKDSESGRAIYTGYTEPVVKFSHHSQLFSNWHTCINQISDNIINGIFTMGDLMSFFNTESNIDKNKIEEWLYQIDQIMLEINNDESIDKTFSRILLEQIHSVRIALYSYHLFGASYAVEQLISISAKIALNQKIDKEKRQNIRSKLVTILFAISHLSNISSFSGYDLKYLLDTSSDKEYKIKDSLYNPLPGTSQKLIE